MPETTLITKLKTYQDKLFQLDRRNRCIFLGRIYKNHNFDACSLPEELHAALISLKQQAVKQTKSVCILPDSLKTDEAEKLRKHITATSRNIKKMEDETGLQYGYLGFPFLTGHITADFYVRGPLALFPVSISKKRGGKLAGWHVGFTGPPIPNHTLTAALKKRGQYGQADELDSGIVEILQQADVDDVDYLPNAIHSLFKKSGMLIDDLPANEINKIQTITANEISEMERQSLQIKNHIVIGSFPQGDSAIYDDYESMLQDAENGDVSDFIADMLDETEVPVQFEEDKHVEHQDDVGSDNMNTVLDSDSSQDLAVISSQKSKVTIIRGPPGTGKSQAIVNMISNALSKHQTVLVVCQKRAALEVVHQRLSEKNLGFCAVLLNKEGQDRAKMYQQLKMIMDHSPDSTKDCTGRIEVVNKRIDGIISKHKDAAFALHERHFGGVTARELYVMADPNYEKKMNIADVAGAISYNELDYIIADMDIMADGFKKFDSSTCSWKNRLSFADLSASDKNLIIKSLENILKSCTHSNVIDLDPDSMEKVLDFSTTCHGLMIETEKLKMEVADKNLNIKTIIDKQSMPSNCSTYDREFMERVKAGVILYDKTGSRGDILRMQASNIITGNEQDQVALIAAFSADDESKWKRIKDKDARERYKLKEKFKASSNTKRDDFTTKEMLKNGMHLRRLAENSSVSQYILSGSYLADNKKAQGELHAELKALKEVIDKINIDKSMILNLCLKIRALGVDLADDPQQGEMSDIISKTLNTKTVLESWTILSKFVNSKELNEIRKLFENVGKLSDKISEMLSGIDDFEKMQEHDARKADLSNLQLKLLEKCAETLSPDDAWAEAIRQEIYLEWINLIEKKRPVLRGGHFVDYKKSSGMLASMLAEKTGLVKDQITHDIYEKTDYTFVPGKRRSARETKYRTLSYELGKKRRVKSVRNLFEEYGHILMDMAPCWLASPEIVSNVFPLEEIFDLVIVDEASQLAVERALPFLQRGSRIVVSGDEKQLQPYDLFQFNVGEEQEEEVLNITSLLEMVSRRYAPITLRWHYRSKFQELIDFSNHMFYDGMLHVAPNARKKYAKPAIEWVKCDNGVWDEKRFNLLEAELVVDTFYDILKDTDNPPTIGVITFNAAQRDAIMDVIEKRRIEDEDFNLLYTRAEKPASGRKDDEIFVRNIENVQGDERDVIIFSIAYAEKEDGSMPRSGFGGLSGAYGPNRLNVAITRAGRKIIVVSSVEPETIPVKDASSEGIRMFRRFLSYAKQVSSGGCDLVSAELAETHESKKGSRSDNARDPLCDDVIKSMAERGYKMQAGSGWFGLDMAIEDADDPDRYLLGIECDGSTYSSAESVMERDVMRQRFLKKVGWNTHRIYSRNWWKDKEKEIDALEEMIKTKKGCMGSETFNAVCQAISEAGARSESHAETDESREIHAFITGRKTELNKKSPKTIMDFSENKGA